jgi:UDP-glucuronate decarboxylase
MSLDNIPDSSGFRGRKILVTGCAGFLGSWLSEVLVECGSDVVCVDNFATGHESNISHLKTHSNFEFRRLDIAEKVPDDRFDMIFHFASRASPDEYQLHPVETLVANSIGTHNVLQAARRHDAMVIYASSSEIYGHPDVFPTPESHWGRVNPVGPRSCYDEGKRFGEAMGMAYVRAYNLDVRIVRIFNTYGPRIRGDGAYARALSRFIVQALKGKPLTIYGDGSQTRSFCYVADTLAGILRVATADAAKGQQFNVGNPQEITILSLANLVGQLVGSHFTIVYSPLPEDDPPRRCPDISKARSVLGWEPKVELKDGLSKTVDWFRRKEEAPV